MPSRSTIESGKTCVRGKQCGRCKPWMILTFHPLPRVRTGLVWVTFEPAEHEADIAKQLDAMEKEQRQALRSWPT